MSDFQAIMNKLEDRRRQYLAALDELNDWVEESTQFAIRDPSALSTAIQMAEESCTADLPNHEDAMRKAVGG